jgi:predicted glutamine amidotransferase
MCRLMGFASITETSLSNIAGDSFSQFAALADRHKDGWGFSNDSSLVKEMAPAGESQNFEKAIAKNQTAALLHFRFASTGINVQESNSHPFMLNGISFIHNGTIKPATTVDPLVAPDLLAAMTGTTDSERYFLAILTAARVGSIPDAIMETVRNIKATGNFSSLNAMLLTPDLYIIVSEHDNSRIPKDEPADYYRLSYKASTAGVLVASSGWEQKDWVPIPNHTMMIVERKNLAFKLITI